MHLAPVEISLNLHFKKFNCNYFGDKIFKLLLAGLDLQALFGMVEIFSFSGRYTNFNQ